ncbi:MAG: hypothetical protein ACK46Q_03340 [Hyphomonas sp.]
MLEPPVPNETANDMDADAHARGEIRGASWTVKIVIRHGVVLDY